MTKTILESIVDLVFFLAIGFLMWRKTGVMFYIYNFGYIGLAVGTGNFVLGILPKE